MHKQQFPYFILEKDGKRLPSEMDYVLIHRLRVIFKLFALGASSVDRLISSLRCISDSDGETYLNFENT